MIFNPFFLYLIEGGQVRKYQAILKAALAKEKIAHNNKFAFLGYNPPYDLVNRRNEVIVELVNYK